MNLLDRLPEAWHVTLMCFEAVTSVQEEPLPAPLTGRLIRVPRPIAPGGWRGSPLVQLLRPQPTMFWKFRCSAFEQLVRDQARDADGVLAIGLQMGQYLRSVPSSLPTAIDNYNVETVILERLAMTRSGLRRLYWQGEAAKMARSERALLRRTPAVFAISDIDRATMAKMVPGVRVLTVPMGLNLKHFRPDGELAPAIPTFTFVGAFNWHVNEDAATWLAAEVWPLVRAQLPEAQLHLVGRDPSAVVRALSTDPSITISGTVPDVRPYLWRSTALLVPLRYGSGVRTKILEGFAAGRPVVSTSVGCEGLPVKSGRELLTADNASEFANACVRLTQDAVLRSSLTRMATSFVREQDSRATVDFHTALVVAFSSRFQSDESQISTSDAHPVHH